MPTPEAVKLMHKLRTPGTYSEFKLNDKEAAEALDRFAAQRGAEAAPEDVIVDTFIDLLIADPDALAGPKGAHLLEIMRALHKGAPPQTDGDDALPKPTYAPGRKPCGECHLQPGEVCDICGAENE